MMTDSLLKIFRDSSTFVGEQSAVSRIIGRYKINTHASKLMNLTAESNALAQEIQSIDDQLSKRSLALDPSGYFIIFIDRQQNLICAKHYSNLINEQGLAVDPETGKPIPAKGKVDRQAVHLFTGRTAKELCVEIFEKTDFCPVSMFDHAAYLGREAQRAELAMLQQIEYIQD